MDLEFDGIYRSWIFSKHRLVTDKSVIPLAEAAIHNFGALEVCDM